MKNYLDLKRSKTFPFMRDVFIDQVYEASVKDKDIFFMTPDMGAPALDKYRENISDQFIHCGICEQHMIAMAAGLSLMDKNVFCYAMAPFITSRCYEQIKCSLAAMDQKVNLVGIGIGLGYADAGPTHYSTEDLATMRVFPNMEILTPCDELSTRAVAKYAIDNKKLRFIRLDRDALPPVYKKEEEFDISQSYKTLIENGETCIISNGYLLNKLFHFINENQLKYSLIDLYRSSPLPDNLIQDLKKYKKIYTVEEQWIDGGLGSQILELVHDNNINIEIKRIGLDKIFYLQNGGRDYLHKNHGIDLEQIFL